MARRKIRGTTDMAKAVILVIDDDPNLRKTLADILKVKGYATLSAGDGTEGLALIEKNTVDLALIDLGLPDISGLEVLTRIKAEYPATAVIILTGNATLESALESTNRGAFSYLVKPYEIDQLMLQIRRAIEKLRADTALKESEARFRDLLESAPDGILIVNDAREIIMVNRRFEEMFGYDRSEVVGQDIGILTPPRFLTVHEGAVDYIRNPNIQRIGQHKDFYLQRSNGSELPVEISRSPLKTPEGNAAGSVCIARDSRERIQARQERERLHARLLQAQKLESVGQLAAGIAHEINTPAQFISTNIAFLQEAFIESSQALTSLLVFFTGRRNDTVTEAELTASEEIVDHLDWDYLKEEIPRAIAQSQEGIRRITSLVEAMKEFAQPLGRSKTACDLNRIIETTITVASNRWSSVATVVTDLDPGLLPVPCIADEMSKVFLNLLINSVQAIEEKNGDQPEAEKGRIAFSTRQLEGQAEIRISDTGCGIPEQIRDRVFDPFFTTRDVGEGIGQGLAIVHDVVTGKHQGTLSFETEPGAGTTFIIRLPIGRDGA